MRCLNVLLSAAVVSGVTLQNDFLVATFDTTTDASTFGNIQEFRSTQGANLLRDGDSALWHATVADSRGYTRTLQSTDSADRVSNVAGDVLTLNYNNIDSTIGSKVSVSVRIALNESFLEILPTFTSDGNVALVDWTINVDRVILKTSSKLLENAGFGILHDCGTVQEAYEGEAMPCEWGPETQGYVPSCPGGSTTGCMGYSTLEKAQDACVNITFCTAVTKSGGQYQLRGGTAASPSPTGETSWLISNWQQCHAGETLPVTCTGFAPQYPAATYQYMTSYDAAAKWSGFYMGAHDKAGSTKHFSYQVQKAAPSSASASIMSVSPDSSLPLTTTVGNYAVTLTVYDGEWWDSTQIYRKWALENADWTKEGPVATREDIPDWLDNSSVWINSHWQQNDIFNVSGGDPELVLYRVKALKERFGLSAGTEIGLHWYEWDTLGYELGSNYSKCATEVTCGFDTHYPEYFPPRKNFPTVVKALQAEGVRVAPYINGRIFDINTKTWSDDSATQYASKNLPSPKLNPSDRDLSNYEESYGSRAVFNVMCPHTNYWQDTISNVTAELVNTYEVDGVYLDQIASAGPRPCWDKSHNHTLGGGSHWVSGYREMMRQVRAKQSPSTKKVYLTESNAEPFMDVMTVYLTLVGFSVSFVGERRLVNAFGGIYGGYYYGMGQEFFQKDFYPNPDVFSSKIAKQFTYGNLMGWFSLGGRDNQNPAMGVYDQLMDPQYDPEVTYLRTLSDAMRKANYFFIQGRSGRELSVVTSAPIRHHPTHPRATRDYFKHSTSHGGPHPPVLGVSYQEVTTSTYLSATSKELLCVLTNVARGSSHNYTFTVDPVKYGMKGTQVSSVYGLTDFFTGKMVAKFTNEPVTYTASIGSHEVHLLMIEILV